ncbi:MAG: long-chain fatty acid--CoA ligase [Chloroflexota bacterium]|nr:MAG: long-chain fatty acid--CoA ligase [Chloroflexota bacterium]
MYIGDIAGRRAIYSPEALAVVDSGKTPHLKLTYRQLNNRANRLAHWLRVQGIGKGDVVGILARDGVEYLDLFFACGKLGAILALYNWRSHPRELVSVLTNTQPKLLFFSGEFGESARFLKQTCPSLQGMVHYEGGGVSGSYDYLELLANAPETPIHNDSVEAEDIACLIFTGGTTGLPKAAQISHRMIAWNTLNTIIHDLQHGDITVNVFPMFHTGGLLVYTVPLLILGGTVVLTRQFDAAQVLNLIQEYGATVFAGVPTMYQLMTQAPNWASADLSKLRFCTSGGAPLPIPLVEQFQREKGVRFKQGFGMTEFGPGIFALAPEDAIRKAGSIGRPNFFVDARLVDENNQPVPTGAIGELVLKGPSALSGYFNNPEASAAAFDEQGWFHTGDLARCDEEWYFYIVDRKKDMFISGGENVYPAEIEQVLYKHPAVLQCAVIGVPDAKWGEVGKACVVLKPGAQATPEELIAHMSEYLARYKVPKSVEIMDALPISAAGKILKRELRAKFVQSAESN